MKVFDFTIYIAEKSPDGEFLISPFLDISFLDTTDNLFSFNPDWISFSGGMEIYVVFDSYRSYPICATFGVNLEDAIEVIQGHRGLPDMEFEIILSLSMFY